MTQEINGPPGESKKCYNLSSNDGNWEPPESSTKNFSVGLHDSQKNKVNFVQML